MTIFFTGEKEKWTMYLMFLPNFKILGAAVPENSSMKKKVYTQTDTGIQRQTLLPKRPKLYTPCQGKMNTQNIFFIENNKSVNTFIWCFRSLSILINLDF